MKYKSSGFKRVSGCLASAATMLLMASGPAEAAIYHLEIGNGAVPESGPALLADFEDINPGVVSFTLSAVDLGSGGKLTRLFLNIDPSISPKSLVFSPAEKVGSFALPSIKKGKDKFNGGPTGKYDLRFNFSSNKAFQNGEAVTFQISAPNLLASSFLSLSTPIRNHDPSYAAARLRWPPGTRPPTQEQAGSSAFSFSMDNSYTPVPEPSSISLALLTGVIVSAKRTQKRQLP